jgi:hypothetical protein
MKKILMGKKMLMIMMEMKSNEIGISARLSSDDDLQKPIKESVM